MNVKLPYYTRLISEAGERGLSVELPLEKTSGKTPSMKIEVKSGDKVIDYEIVKTAENIEDTGHRIYRRMKKDKVI
jgi:hypothetical protein